MQSITDENYSVKNYDCQIVKTEVFVYDENVNFEFCPPTTNIEDFVKCDSDAGHLLPDNTSTSQVSSRTRDNEFILPDLETEKTANKIRKKNKKGYGQFKCQLCSKSYSSRGSLKSHKYTVHSKGNSRQYPCKLCGKIFSQSGHRSRHLKEFHRKSHEKLRYKCDVCTRSLTRLESLKTHKRFHCPGKIIGETYY